MNPLKPIIDYIDKARSYIYGIYIFWVLIFSSPIILTALFTDQSILFNAKHKLKNEYIASTYFDLTQWYSYAYLALIIFGSAAMTWLIIWRLPKWIVNKAYIEEINNQYLKEELRIIKEQELEDKKSQNIDKKIQNIEKEEEAVDKQEDLASKEQRQWTREYNVFKKSNMYDDFDDIVDSIIDHYGRIRETDFKNTITWSIDKELLAYAASNELVDLNQEDASINLTKKGNHFLKLYQLDTQTDE
jgi:hypothetical protein